jgi:hypothetical protein
MKLKVIGYVRHRFWGEYSAALVLLFESKELALLAQPVLNTWVEDYGVFYNAGGGYSNSGGWRYVEGAKGNAERALFCDCADPALKQLVNRFVKLGADRKKILSLAKSIDFGEEFSFEMEVEDPAQTKLL